MFCVDNLGMVYIKHSVTTQHTWQYTQDVNSFLTSESKSFQLLEQLKRGSWQTQQIPALLSRNKQKLLWQYSLDFRMNPIENTINKNIKITQNP